MKKTWRQVVKRSCTMSQRNRLGMLFIHSLKFKSATILNCISIHSQVRLMSRANLYWIQKNCSGSVSPRSTL
uniref:Uncharacterized protein n=1 Tax=Pararge aegeria TaxID=116150 RepID=S4PRL7_9NEOP